MSTRYRTPHRPAASSPSRRGRQRSFLAGLGAVLALGAIGCSSEGGLAEAQSTSSPTKRIGISLPDIDSDFYQDLLAGARGEAERQGVRLTIRNAQDDARQQSTHLEQLASDDVSSVVVSPVDAETGNNGLRQLADAGVPAVAVNRTLGKLNATSVIASDHAPTGRLAADALAAAVDEKGTVAVLHGTEESAAGKGEDFGFRDSLSKYKRITVVAHKTAHFDQKTARARMAEILATHPGIDGVFAANDAMALGAAQAIEDWGLKNISVVGLEGTAAGLNAVRSGKLYATITQQPEEIGKAAVRNALRAAHGEKIDKRILMPLRVVTRDNVEKFG